MTTALTCLSPLDGRYQRDVAELEAYFSESALMRYRVRVEIEYLIMLSKARDVATIVKLDATQVGQLRNLYRNFSEASAAAIAAYDAKVNHDVKAVEYWIRDQLDNIGLGQLKEMVHFGLTSEDVNNLAYSLMVREARDLVMSPAIGEVMNYLHQMAIAEAHTPMPARTHGQIATPTTFGKEMAVFLARLQRTRDQLNRIPLTGKLTGATGTLAAHVVAMPDVDWQTFSRAFVRTLDLEPVILTTQIEPQDTIAEVCDALKRICTILIDLDQDLWRYVSDGFLVQRPKAGEVGSSTMPHKVNPIDFENAEGNFGIAIALLEFFSRKLPISRLQRDLTGSTVLRNLGVAFGHMLLACRRTAKGLGKISPNRELMYNHVVAHPEVLAEAYQTILRRAGVAEPYELLKNFTRGKSTVTLADMHEFVRGLPIADTLKQELLALTPQAYLGVSAQISLTIQPKL
jgi:adenylosuccinate lyase